MSKIKDTEQALLMIEDAGRKYGEAIELGNSKAANKSYVIIKNAMDFLEEENQISALKRFVDHPSSGVRIWAANISCALMNAKRCGFSETLQILKI